MREGDMCPRWPSCSCVMQGYVNVAERDDCGRKPKTRRHVHAEDEMDEVVDRAFRS